MSVGRTEAAVRSQRKTVTRRVGWLFAKPGDHVTLVRKSQGRKPGEPVVRIAEVEIVDVRREPLSSISFDDVAREGVSPAEWARTPHDRRCPLCAPESWARWFALTMGGGPDQVVTRIEWRYL